MWLFGLIIGAGLGAVFGHGFEGALLGLVAGLLSGRRPERESLLDEHLRDLETRIAALERRNATLAARLLRLENGGNGEPADGVEGDAAAAPSPAVPGWSAPAAAARMDPDRAADLGTGSGPVPVAAPPAVPGQVSVDTAAAAGSGRFAEIEHSPAWNEPAGGEGGDPLAALWQRLIAGNILAKIGVALLFFGVASALKLAAEQGWLPPALRLLLGGLAGGAMVGFGWSRREDAEHRIFGQVLQGGGFGLLYLLVYFALAWYGLIGHGFAFVLFALLGLACTLLSLGQEAPVLAVIGLAGAFLAPILAASGTGSHIVLFTYYLLLNGFIFGLAWLRDWRALNATGFLFTFAVGLAWAWRSYRPEHYLSTQVFLILFFLLYSATPTLFALLRAPGRAAWDEALLLFGTPVAGILLQAPLVDDTEYDLAWSAFLAGIYYLGLWLAVWRREGREFELLRLTQFGIGVGFLTLAVPLAFGAATTVAIWSVEGAATLWLSLRLARPLGKWFGLLAQVGAGFWLLGHGPELAAPAAFRNGLYTGGMLVALAGLASAGMIRGNRPTADFPPANLALGWGLLWWYGTWLHEIEAFAPAPEQAGLGLLLVAATALAGEGIGARLAWPALRQAGTLLLPALTLAVLAQWDRERFVLQGLMALALPVAFSIHYLALYRRERDGGDDGLLRPWLHAGAAWLLVFVLTHDAAARVADWSFGRNPWPALVLGLVPAGVLGAVLVGLRRACWPFGGAAGLYRQGLVRPLGWLLAAWFAWTSCTEPGGGFSPYLPLLDPLDLGLAAVLAAIAAAFRDEPGVRARLLLALGLVGLGGLAARLAHHYGGVAFTPLALLDSALMQALLSGAWTLLAIALMISGARAGARERWFAGFGLLAVVGAKLLLLDLGHAGTLTWTASLIGIALLVLAAAYFAPMPPRESGRAESLPADQG